MSPSPIFQTLPAIYMRHISSDNIQFDLIENGLDFVSSGVEHILKDKSPHLLKYAILHLSAGTELLLKEMLKNEHWSYLSPLISWSVISNLNT